MVLEGRLPVGRLDLVCGGRSFDLEYLVRINRGGLAIGEVFEGIHPVVVW